MLVVGDASVANETNEIAETDLVKGETFAVPVALVILVLVDSQSLVIHRASDLNRRGPPFYRG